MAQKDVTINDILNGGKGSPGNGGTTATGNDGGTSTASAQSSTSGAGTSTPPTTDGTRGVVDFGNGEDVQAKKPVTTAEATDPTQAAINVVEQHRQQQAQKTPTPASTGNVADDFLNFSREQNGQTPKKSPVFNANVQTTSPSEATGANGDGGKDKDAAAVDTEPQGSQKKSAMKYADMFAAMEPYKEPTKEQLEKERKKEKRERLFAALGDGISALSNLFFTTQYAPNMYNPKETNSERVDDYWTKLRDEREANRRRYVDGYLKAKQADDLHDIQQQIADVNDFYKRSEAERKAKAQEIIDAKTQAMTDYYNEKAKGIGKADEAQLVYLKTKIDCLNRGMSIKEAVAAAQIAKLKAEANKANRTGGSGGKGGRTGGRTGGGSGGHSGGKRGVTKSSGGEYIAYDKDGNIRHFKQKGAAEQFAREQGTWQTDYSNSTSTKYGITTTTRRPNGGHSVRPKVPAKQVKKVGSTAKGGNWASGLKL